MTITAPSGLSNVKDLDQLTRFVSIVIQSLVDYANSTPATGVILALGGTSVPDGYLECDGSVVSRISFRNLFAVIGESYGRGDGTATFNLPDLRGRSLRGWSHSSGNDAGASTRTALNPGGNTGDNVGSFQALSSGSSAPGNVYVMFIIKT